MNKKSVDSAYILKLVSTVMFIVWFVMILMGLTLAGIIITPKKIVEFFHAEGDSTVSPVQATQSFPPEYWKVPDIKTIPTGPDGDEIMYGRELVAHTSEYLGPKGKVMAISNGMNCQNCHLDAGTKPFGNNYSAVASTYPKFRPRSGTNETIEKRVNDCLERSLNGQALADDSREMRAIVSYIKWVGHEVPKGETPKGAGLVEVQYLDVAADSVKGKIIYRQKCVVCHGKNGEGILSASGTAWTYPPLWGKQSYNDGAGLYRLSRFAGYIKANMPLGTTFLEPQLTDEESWHLAAYVNSLERPAKDKSMDWPDISKKPFDHPFGPFTDGFDETKHKYGPFKPIVEKRELLSKSK